ncbi:MAG TPA: PilN domain-containing protein [Terriglobia bacterium]|nr:PilN domain-containing protein [Terriglobia bacterium]
MIKVNLVGAGRKKSAKAGFKIALPASFTPVLLILILVGTAGGGFWWYTSLNKTVADLDMKKAELDKQKAALDAVIKADQVYEARKKELEKRVKVVKDLQRNQASPVVALDQLSDAVERTKYVWLSNLDQKEAILNMSGTGTSLDAIADFSTNLTSTGYFKNIDLGTASQDASGNWAFSLKCEFSPPRPAAATGQAGTAGGN